jgi:hypothetical protein
MKKAELELLKIVRCFHRFSSCDRADMASSHRLGPRQRHAIGQFFWVTELRPGVAFETRGAAVDAARAVLASQQTLAAEAA